MSDSTAARLVVSRLVQADVAEVYRAWIDSAQLERWFTPEASWAVRITHNDSRVGGSCTAEFGPAGEPPYVETLEYTELSPPTRLAFRSVMSREGRHLGTTEVTVELRARGAATEVVVTETGVDPAHRDEREAGWGSTLGHLVTLYRAGEESASRA